MLFVGWVGWEDLTQLFWDVVHSTDVQRISALVTQKKLNKDFTSHLPMSVVLSLGGRVGLQRSSEGGLGGLRVLRVGGGSSSHP